MTTLVVYFIVSLEKKRFQSSYMKDFCGTTTTIIFNKF